MNMLRVEGPPPEPSTQAEPVPSTLHTEVTMLRFSRLSPFTLTSFATYLLLAACGDGGQGDDGSMGPGGSLAGMSATPGGASNAGAPTGGSPVAGQPAAGGSSAGGASTGGTAGVATSGGAVGTGGERGGVGGVTGGGAGGLTSGGNAGTGGGSSPMCSPMSNIMCGSACVDPQSSEQHCGACGKACVSGQECERGKCECQDDLQLCSDECVDTDADEQHCGNCGTKCSSGQTCDNGKCTGGSTGTTCSSVSEFGTVSATIVVKNGETYDGQCRRYRADASKLGDGSQDEGQKPVFIVEDGGKLINVVLGAPAADGIHTKGTVTLENITWEDIGEDAMTIKESGTVTLNGGSAKNGEDKVFQINAASTFRISNFKASNAGKFIRQNGDSTFKTQVFIDKCDISDMDEAIFRTDSSSSTVSMTNTRYHAIGDALFVGVSAANITQSNNTAY
jgi:Pectate lyase